jgi:hypothetical protein
MFHVSPLGLQGYIFISLLPVDNEDVAFNMYGGVPREVLPGITRLADVVRYPLESPLIVPYSLNV